MNEIRLEALKQEIELAASQKRAQILLDPHTVLTLLNGYQERQILQEEIKRLSEEIESLHSFNSEYEVTLTELRLDISDLKERLADYEEP